VPSDSMRTFRKLLKVMEAEMNWKAYRSRCRHLAPPYVPAVAPVLLVDLFKLLEVRMVERADKPPLVNCFKLDLATRLISTYYTAVSRPYAHQPLVSIHKGLHSIAAFDDAEIRRLSRLKEKRAGEGGDHNEDDEGGRKKTSFKQAANMIVSGARADSSRRMLTDRDWSIIMAASKTVTVSKGEKLCERGRPCSYLYFIVEGSVQLDYGIVTQTMLADESLGYFSVIGYKSMFDAVVESDRAVVKTLDMSQLRTLMRDKEELCIRFFVHVGVQLAKSIILFSCLPPSVVPALSSLNSEPPSQPCTPLRGSSPAPTMSIRETAPAPLSLSVAYPGVRLLSPPKLRDVGRINSNISLTGESSADLMQASKDAQFRKVFHLPSSEVILETFKCKLKSSARVVLENTHWGTLYVSKNYVCHIAEFLMSRHKRVVPMKALQGVKRRKSKRAELILLVDSVGSVGGAPGESRQRQLKLVFLFQKEQDAQVAHDLLHQLWQSSNESTASVPLLTSDNSIVIKVLENGHVVVALPGHSFTLTAVNEMQRKELSVLAGVWIKQSDGEETARYKDVTDSTSFSETLTTRDWELLLNGARKTTVKKGDIIITAGERYDTLFYILKGQCRANVKERERLMESSHVRILADDILDERGAQVGKSESKVMDCRRDRIMEGEVFGEMQFLAEDAKSALMQLTVVAEQDCELTLITTHFIETMFSIEPGFELRFFVYIADVLFQRLVKRQGRFSVAALRIE